MDNALVLLPEFLLVLLSLAILVFGRHFPRHVAPLATFGLVAVFGVLVGQALTGAVSGSAFAQAVQIGPFAWLIRGVLLLMAAASSALAWGEAPRRPDLTFGLLLASAVGALGVAASADAVILYLSLTLMGMALTGLVAQSREHAAKEATMKVFLFQAVAGAVLLFGLTWLFGLGGSTSFVDLAAALQTPDTLLTFAMLLVLGGLAFTVAAVPFHAWLPDVTEGSSLAVGSWLLGGAGLAAVAGLVRILIMLFATNTGLWAPYVTGLAVLSLLGGGLLALAQSDLRRMLAFGAVGTSGLVLLALVAASHPASSQEGLMALLMTALTAGIATLGIFAGLGAAKARSLTDLTGLHRRAPGLALALSACALALAALPLSGAFWARVTLVRSLLVYVSQSMQFGALALAVLAMGMTVLAAYTALRIPKAIYLSPGAAPSGGEAPSPHGAVLWICALLSVFFFVAPALLWSVVGSATKGF
ncbi:NADH-quinone oxidoreductase subunit N [compost metagenome]